MFKTVAMDELKAYNNLNVGNIDTVYVEYDCDIYLIDVTHYHFLIIKHRLGINSKPVLLYLL
jgi:hypothetical protein